MSAITEYKCPSCGGSVEFDSSSQKMKCPYCDTEFDVEAIEQANNAAASHEDKKTDWGEAGTEWGSDETAGMKVYVCNSCGGEIIVDETTSATKCPFCDNQITLKGQFEGALRPDLVIPFKLNKEDAKKAYMNHISGKKFLPKTFKDKNHIDEIKGVYVPYWLYTCDADANALYDACRIRTWSDRNYNYTETSHYNLYRSGAVAFNSIPVDGSSKMPDELMESIEPFDVTQGVDFKAAYLSGYLADKYDVSCESSKPRADERIRQSIADVLKGNTAQYSSVNTRSVQMSLSNGSVKYALYPVWLLNTTFNGRKYTFAMNGQTGKMVGDLPRDDKLYYKYFGFLSTGLTAALYALSLLLFR